MKIHIISVGEPKHEYAQLGVALYGTRLARHHKLKIVHVRDSKKTGLAKKTEEGERLLTAIGNVFCITLEVKGKNYSSEQLSAWLENLATQGTSEIAFVIGGPDGLSDEVRNRANASWSLSNLTLPHDLALLVMLEALYRAATIAKNEPYHRG